MRDSEEFFRLSWEGSLVEPLVAGIEDFGGCDSLDHFCGAVVSEVELVAVFDVLDDVGFASEWGGFLWVGWA